MKKRFLLTALAIVCTLLLTACGKCEHNWKKATCENPKTCRLCGETQGSVKDHAWVDATCTEPKTCETCGKSTGSAAGHHWTDATCEEPMTCTICGETNGDSIGHWWESATFDAPKTCRNCGKTEGEPRSAPTFGVESYIGFSPDIFVEGMESIIRFSGYSVKYEKELNDSAVAYRLYLSDEPTDIYLLLTKDAQGGVQDTLLTGPVTDTEQLAQMYFLAATAWTMVDPTQDPSSTIAGISDTNPTVKLNGNIYEISVYESNLIFAAGRP